MTAAAVGPKFTIVNIIGEMAVGTAIARLAHRRKRAAVATFAGDIDMRAVQFKISLSVVIKQPQVERNRVMAQLAFTVIDAIVVIVFKMAIDAGAGCVGKLLCGVTIVTFNIVVFSQ